jgi:hypothetical protein
LAFGDYCEVYGGDNNTSRPRSVPCIALYLCNNAAGSWAFMNLMMKQVICCTQWLKRVLGAHLFTVEKFTANGEHDKLKSRLISHGIEQD